MLLKNAFNYTGSKDRILPQLLNNLDYTKDTFIDFFCGSAVVSANVLNKFNRIIANDGCWQLINILGDIQKDKDFINKVDKIISEYNLGKNNKEEFLKLRETYNNEFKNKAIINSPMLYALITHAFNYFLIFTKDGRFSVPSGKGRSSFNSSIRSKLKNFQQAILGKELEFYSFKMSDFIKIIKTSYKQEEIRKIMVYFDPPYSTCCSDSSVNRSYGLHWNDSNDLMLLDFCDWLNDNGASFTLSNVFENNGKENLLLKEWASKYKVIPIDLDYNNCHYQRKNNGQTKEVLIRNF